MSNFLSSSMALFLPFTVLLGLSSSSFLALWWSMELNLMIFICCVAFRGMNLKSSILKYFIIQSLGTMGVFLSIILLNLWQSHYLSWLFLMLFLLLKLGFPPFHFWLINIMPSMDFLSIFILSVIQKLLPLFLVSNLLETNLEVMISLGILVGTMGMMSSKNIFTLLGYSSVVALSWTLSVIPNLSLVFQQLGAYSMALSLFLMISAYIEKYSAGSLMKFSQNSLILILAVVSALSLGGMPPFLGFFVKLNILEFILLKLNSSVVVVLVSSVPFALFSYLKFVLNLSAAISPSSIPYGKVSPSSSLLLLVLMLLTSSWIFIFLFSSVIAYSSLTSKENLKNLKTKMRSKH